MSGIMHAEEASRWSHSHDFEQDASGSERRTRIVIAITLVMMVAEIAAGTVFQSMALLADGWHMGTHAAAFFITALAYWFRRRHASDPLFSFGTGKIGVLGGFASAVILGVVALIMASESLLRAFSPVEIAFNEALGVAVLGLAVNLVCARLLHEGGAGHDHTHHGHSHGHHHGHGHSHDRDLNRRAAFLHVLADALTSVTAILALLGGKYLGWLWLDPVMGLAGSVMVAIWAVGLLRDTGGILLDRTPADSDLRGEIRKSIEADGFSRIVDLHVWCLAPERFAAIISVVSSGPKAPEAYKERLREHEELVHVTVEVIPCGPK